MAEHGAENMALRSRACVCLVCWVLSAATLFWFADVIWVTVLAWLRIVALSAFYHRIFAHGAADVGE